MSDLTMRLNEAEVGLPSLFFRAADRFRLEGCVAGLVRDGRSLAFSSDREAVLDHYSRLLIARLRESSPLSPLEVYFPADTAAMLARFNDVLAEQSVQQAMQLPGLDAPPRIWIVHDAGALADHEVKLLARLVQNFPGANIRIVLLLGTSVQSRQVFDSIDRRILRWDIEAPTPEQAAAMLVQGREDGCEGAVKALLKKLEATVPGAPVIADPAGIDPLGFQSPPTKSSTEIFTFAEEIGKGRAKRRVNNASKKARHVLLRTLPIIWRWVVSVVLLAGLSVGVTAWLHPTVFSIDRDKWTQQWVKLTSNSAAPPAAVKLAPAPLPNPAVVELLKPVPEPVPEPVPVPTSQSLNLTAKPAVTQTNTAKPAPLAVIASAPPTVQAGPVAVPTTAKLSTAANGLAAEGVAERDWVNAMPASSFVVQYAAMQTYQEAAVWKKGAPGLAESRIVAVYRPRGKFPYYVVLSGPFTTTEQATLSTTDRGKPAGALVRTAMSIRQQFNSDSTNTEPLQEPTR